MGNQKQPHRTVKTLLRYSMDAFIPDIANNTRFNPRKTNFSGSDTSFSIASRIEVIPQPVPKQPAFRTGNQ